MSAWASHLRRQATRTHIQDMIDYQKRTRSRYPRSGLSLPPRSNSVVTAMVWASSAALNVVVWGASWKGVLSLLDVYRTTPPAEWVSPLAVGVAAFVLTVLGGALLLKLGTPSLLRLVMTRERNRGVFASDLYAGPGLRGHPRLEP